MPSFAVRYRSRGELREVRWTDGALSAEPLVETIVAALIRQQRVVRAAPGAPSRPATLEEAEPAALTILEALYDVGAHIVEWVGDPRGIAGERSGNERLR
ncbi:MAG: hypothetical protein QOH79_800 [Acidimicrobiaceae bacterium]